MNASVAFTSTARLAAKSACDVRSTKVTAWMAAIAGLLTVAVGIFALGYAATQVKLGREQRSDASSLALGQFLLQLDQAFERHQAAHLNLRPGGQWYGVSDRPTDDEMPIATAYMGLFERINIMIDLGLLRPEIVNRLYGYRVGNVWVNDRIMREKLVKLSDGWQDFLELVRRMEKERNEEYVPGRWAEYNELLSQTKGIGISGSRVAVKNRPGASEPGPAKRVPLRSP